MKKGSTRQVLFIGKYAIKFPLCESWETFIQGILHNINEKKWSVLPKFCPVLFSLGGLLNIMPKCGVITDKEFKNIKMDDYFSIPEKKISSFGKLNGKIVAVDYGDMTFYAENAIKFIKSLRKKLKEQHY